jgi:poly(hydroxyalkanoate) depolymerase family esterase
MTLSPDFQHLMTEATRLTQAGDLRGATAAIQQAMGLGAPADPTRAKQAATADARTIDVTARMVAEPGSEPVQAEPARADALKAPESAAADSQFIAGSFVTKTGGRDYKLFIPSGAGQRPLPLLVMLHGCTQTPDDFAAGTAMNELAQAQGCYVLYPEQSSQANPQRCWNWFKHSHQQRSRGEPALLAGMTRQVMAQHPIDPDRVYVAGLSAGGAMAAILGNTYPDLFAAVGVHSGLGAGAASDLPSAFAAMQGRAQPLPQGEEHLPTIVFHGDADATVHPANGKQLAASRADSSVAPEVQPRQGAGGRDSTRSVHRDRAGRVRAEHWVVHGAAHAWSGGSERGSFTDASGPDASAEMLRFFLEHPRRVVG